MRKYLLLLCLIIAHVGLFAQTQTITENVPFSTEHQSMWGTGGGFSLNVNQEIFRLNPSVNFDTGNDGIVNVGGYDFGVGMAVDFWMDVGSNFKIEGLTLGEVDVNYPIQVQFDIPAPGTFDKGDTITINTSYNIDPAGNLVTRYPSGGRTSLDLHFGFGLDVELTFCAFGCVTIPIIPNLQLPVQTIDIFALETQPSISATYPCVMFPCGGGIPCIPDICTTNITPVSVPDNGLGILGEFDIPYVETVSTNDPATQCITATGNDAYMTIGLDIFNFLSNFASRIPPPAGPAIAAVLGNLSNSFSLPFGASLEYTIFAAQFNVVNTNNQDFSFCPDIASKFNLAVPVNFYVTDPTNPGLVLNSGFGTQINFDLGNQIHLHYPCNYEFMDIGPEYSIKNDINFSNHTYDVISFNFAMQALMFNFSMPDIEIIPEICFPEICFTLCYPNPSWDDPFNWDCDNVCTPAFCTPALVFPGFDIGFGPLLDEVIPLGSLPEITYFDESWSLQGFTPVVGTPFQLIPRDFSASMTATDVPCRGDATASATVTLTNGSSPFTYAWDNLQTQQSPANTATMTGLNAGPHFVLVTNRGGCTALGEITIQEPSSYLDIVQTIVTDVSCFGGSDGQIGVIAQGGTGSYSYSWSPSVSTLDTAINVAAGNYIVTVSDANGCDTSRVIIVDEPYPLNLTYTSQNVSCLGGNDGSINLSIAGGTSPFSIQWNSGQQSEDLFSLSAGTYTVVVTDAKNCSATLSITIAGPTNSVVIALDSIHDVSCKYGFDGSIGITPSGGTGSYHYQWTNNNNIVMASTTQVLQNAPAGSYQIMVTDSLGCMATEQYSINEPADALQHNFTFGEVSCYGGSDGFINQSVSGGTPNYNYVWSNGSSTQNINTLSSGNYSVVITDSKGCTLVDSVFIPQPAADLSAQSQVSPVLCSGGNTGSVIVNTSGGTFPYTYLWQNGNTTNQLSNLVAGTYAITITDARQCVLAFNVIVTEPLPLQVTPVVTPVLCHGGNNGMIDLSTSGGIGPYTYQWADADSIILSNVSEDLNNVIAGNYFVLTSDSNQCQFSSIINVPQPAAPLQINLTASNINCFGATTGSINGLVSGGTPPYNYQWSNSSNNLNQNNLAAGQYQLTVTDTAQCSTSASVILSEPSSSLLSSVTPTHVRCFNGQDGAAQLSVNGGVPPYTIAWSNGANSTLITGLSSGTYTASITDANGCISNTGTVINEPSQPLSITFDADSVTCFSGADGSIRINVNGGTQPYQIEWGQSILQMNNIMNHQQLTGLSAGSYMTRVTDGNQCIETRVMNIEQPQEFYFFATAKPVRCYNGSDGEVNIVFSGGVPPYRFLWSDSSTFQNATGLNAGFYNVTITDSNRCVFRSNHVEVTQPDSILISLIITPTSCTDARDAGINAEASGGFGEFIYEWSNGESGPVIMNLPAGVISLLSTDQNGCSRRDSIFIPLSEKNCFDFSNTFTPNGDGKNDTWILDHIEDFPNAEVVILNQWGTVIFESIGYAEPWDGTYKGNPLPSATYYYLIDLKNGQPALTGPVTLLR